MLFNLSFKFNHAEALTQNRCSLKWLSWLNLRLRRQRKIALVANKWRFEFGCGAEVDGPSDLTFLGHDGSWGASLFLLHFWSECLSVGQGVFELSYGSGAGSLGCSGKLLRNLFSGRPLLLKVLTRSRIVGFQIIFGGALRNDGLFERWVKSSVFFFSCRKVNMALITKSFKFRSVILLFVALNAPLCRNDVG